VFAEADSSATASIVDDSSCSSWASAAEAENKAPRRVAAANGFSLNIAVRLLFFIKSWGEVTPLWFSNSAFSKSKGKRKPIQRFVRRFCGLKN
jgi:hypothetical protein